ncbi:hypothetical protein ACI3ER_12160 [Bacillus sp. Wb]
MVLVKNQIAKVIEENCSVGAEVFYQAHISQLTVYLDDSIPQKEMNRLKTIVAKYIGDNMLQDSYKTVKYFY